MKHFLFIIRLKQINPDRIVIIALSTNNPNTINMSALSEISCNMPSICIPKAFKTVTEKMVRDTFRKLDLGEIERIQITPSFDNKGRKFNCIIAHFDHWCSTVAANNVRQKLLAGKEVKIVYDDPVHWRVFDARTEEPSPKRAASSSKVDEFGRERECPIQRENKRASTAFIRAFENLEDREEFENYVPPFGAFP